MESTCMRGYGGRRCLWDTTRVGDPGRCWSFQLVSQRLRSGGVRKGSNES